MKFFIGNWKMFGILSSNNIIEKINKFKAKDRSNKYKIIITPPYTLIESFSKKFKNSNIAIGAQNCFFKEKFSSNTGAISPFMVKKSGANYVIVGHSDNRAEGDNDEKLKLKLNFCLKLNLKVIFCIGENKKEKQKKITFKVLEKQLRNVLSKKFDHNKIIVAYEPIWSIGTGLVPNNNDLSKTINFIKSSLRKLYNHKCPPVLYGGSVDEKNINQLKNLKEIDGFLIGGASKSSKKFIDIIKNYYR